MINNCEAIRAGGMSEWFKEAVLKTVVPKGTVGSNPTPSAKPFSRGSWFVQLTRLTGSTDKTHYLKGEMAELAEGARLLSECGGKLPPRVRIPLSPP